MADGAFMFALEADPADPEDFDVSEAGVDAALAERRKRREGRPKGSTTPNRSIVTLRLDDDVLKRFRANEAAKQSILNEAWRKMAS